MPEPLTRWSPSFRRSGTGSWTVTSSDLDRHEL
jgi:hypothetical protein